MIAEEFEPLIVTAALDPGLGRRHVGDRKLEHRLVGEAVAEPLFERGERGLLALHRTSEKIRPQRTLQGQAQSSQAWVPSSIEKNRIWARPIRLS